MDAPKYNLPEDRYLREQERRKNSIDPFPQSPGALAIPDIKQLLPKEELDKLQQFMDQRAAPRSQQRKLREHRTPLGEDTTPSLRPLPPLPDADDERALRNSPKDALKGILKDKANEAIDGLVEKADQCVGKELDNLSIDGIASLAQMNNFRKLAETNPALLKKYGLDREHLATVDRVMANEKFAGTVGAMMMGPGGMNTEALKELKDTVSPDDWKRLGEFGLAAKKMGESVVGCVVGQDGKEVNGAPHARTAPRHVSPILQDPEPNGRRDL